MTVLEGKGTIDDVARAANVVERRFDAIFSLDDQGGEPANILQTMAGSRWRNFAEFSSFPLIAKVNRGSR